MTDATWFLEVVSYALISAFGAWLLWRKAPLLRGLVASNPMHSLSAAHAHDHTRMTATLTAIAHSYAGHSHADGAQEHHGSLHDTRIIVTS